jgi:hypothetical protein
VTDADDPRLRMRPIGGLLLLAGALLAVLATFVAYGWLWWSGLTGRPATGEQAVLAFEGCHEAIAPITARLGDMGLAPTVTAHEGRFQVQVVLPADPAVAASIPATLARPGRVEVLSGDTVLATNADVVEVVPRLDLRMASYAVLRLSEAATARVVTAVRADPTGHLTLKVDGVEVAIQPNGTPIAKGELEFAPPTDDDERRMRTVAEWAVVLDHGPLPCPVVPVPSG